MYYFCAVGCHFVPHEQPSDFCPFSSILVPQPPSDAVFDDLLDVLAAELPQGECRVDDDVGGELLTFRELMLVGGAGVVGMLCVHEVGSQVEWRPCPVTGVHAPPVSGDAYRHRPRRRVAVDFIAPRHFLMQLFGQFVKRNHE